MKNIDFTKNIKASVEISDLEKLGWDFSEIYQETFAAHQNPYKEEHGELDQGYDMNSAADYVDATYHVDIVVNQHGETYWNLTNTQKAQSGIWEGSDRERTGDDQQTIKDLIQLYSEGNLFNIDTESIYW